MLPLPNMQAISALCLLTITKRFEALIAAFTASPDAKFTYSDFTTLSRILALHRPAKGQKPCAQYLEHEESAIAILGLVLNKLEREAGGYRTQNPSAFAERIAAKASRIIKDMERRTGRRFQMTEADFGCVAQGACASSLASQGEPQARTQSSLLPDPGHSEGRVFESLRNHESQQPQLPTEQSAASAPLPIRANPCSSVEKSPPSSPAATATKSQQTELVGVTEAEFAAFLTAQGLKDPRRKTLQTAG